MTYKYQLIILGNHNDFKQKVIETFLKRIEDLGLNANSVKLITKKNFTHEYDSRNPSVCAYFSSGEPYADIDLLERLITDAVFILPIVPDISNYNSLAPKKLDFINGVELKDLSKIEATSSRLLEGLSLLRESRRLFISYRRIESRSIAIQLYELLDQNGFDVFLDTNSLNPGDHFQDELWHRLVDTDIVILLDTPGFLDSHWTEQELAKASAMSIGILQVIWPEHNQAPYSSLCIPLYLKEDNFESRNYKSNHATLTSIILSQIAEEVESLRARSLASRQDNLIQEFTAAAHDNGITTYLQPEKFLTMFRSDGQEITLIPTVGVPQAFTFNQIEELIKRIRISKMPIIYLLYDHRNIIEKWEKHLTWLNLYLPVKGRKITEVESWIQNL